MAGTKSEAALDQILDNQKEEENATSIEEQVEGQEEDWSLPQFRSKVVERIQDEIMRTASQVPKTGKYLEQFVFTRAKSKKEYLNLVAGVCIYVAQYNSTRVKTEDAPAEETDVPNTEAESPQS